jgi:hypothetical protein
VDGCAATGWWAMWTMLPARSDSGWRESDTTAGWAGTRVGGDLGRAGMRVGSDLGAGTA